MAYPAEETKVGATGRRKAPISVASPKALVARRALPAARGETPLPPAKVGLGWLTVRPPEGRAGAAVAADGAVAVARPSSIAVAARRGRAARALEGGALWGSKFMTSSFTSNFGRSNDWRRFSGTRSGRIGR